MKYYNIYADTYHNGKLIGQIYGGHCLTEEERPEEEVHEITWENLNEKYKELNFLCDFNIMNFKKGRMVCFFEGSIFDKNTWDVKEWKTPLNVKVVVHNFEDNPSMEQLKHFDAVKVQKYLNERLGAQ